MLLRDLYRTRRKLGLRRPSQPSSLAVRHVDAGSCNGCEHELTAAAGPHYDLARFGLSITASPRHADVLLVTGPVTVHMRAALLAAYEAMPEPRIVAALGNCALGRGIIATADSLAGPLEDLLPVSVRIAGCPPTPQQIIDGLEPLLHASAVR
ncbi:MAG TPA: oxidoreductase [Clostridia bacterium]|nr:oxidoreductase [Clostridia bacterium]